MNAITILKEHEDDIRNRFRVKRIGIFGSFARGEAKADSDIDVLVEFETGHKTFDNFMDLMFYLEAVFGRKIDLVTREALKPRIKDNILRDTVYG